MNINIQNGGGGCCSCLTIIFMFAGLLMFMTLCGIINW